MKTTRSIERRCNPNQADVGTEQGGRGDTIATGSAGPLPSHPLVPRLLLAHNPVYWPSVGGSERVLQRVLFWTSGHPYLTQRLCQAVAEESVVTDPAQVRPGDVLVTTVKRGRITSRVESAEKSIDVKPEVTP